MTMESPGSMFGPERPHKHEDPTNPAFRNPPCPWASLCLCGLLAPSMAGSLMFLTGLLLLTLGLMITSELMGAWIVAESMLLSRLLVPASESTGPGWTGIAQERTGARSSSSTSSTKSLPRTGTRRTEGSRIVLCSKAYPGTSIQRKFVFQQTLSRLWRNSIAMICQRAFCWRGCSAMACETACRLSIAFCFQMGLLCHFRRGMTCSSLHEGRVRVP